MTIAGIRTKQISQKPQPGGLSVFDGRSPFFDVRLRWACSENEVGDTFRFQLADAAFSAKVPGTGTWEIYKAEKFARLNLPAGQQRAVFRAEVPLRAYLIDLLEVRLVPITAQTAATPAAALN